MSAVEDGSFVAFRWNRRDQSPGEGTRGALERLIEGWPGAVVI